MALVKDAYVLRMPNAVAAARSGRVHANDTTHDDTTDEEDVVATVVTKRVEEMLPAGLGAEHARCRAEALRNRRHQEGDLPRRPRRGAPRRREAGRCLRRADAARQKELQQAASQQYRENRRFRAARVREERERISEGGCADDDTEADQRRTIRRSSRTSTAKTGPRPEVTSAARARTLTSARASTCAGGAARRTSKKDEREGREGGP